MESRHRYISNQINALASEISRLAIACDIDVFDDSAAERILKDDQSICGRTNPEAFRKIRQHLMALFPLEEFAIDRIGANETRDIMDQVRAAIIALREAGSPGSTPRSG